MCGIAGILDFARAPSDAELTAMIARLHHRGPDGHGLHREGPVGLAHARLSIIDLAGGAQPLCNEDGTVWVSFNGEIFNYLELRESLLARGHRFATHSDTEVLVHLYEEHGDDLVQHLNGQFAFALWDARAQCLLLARDRVGIRPLFHARVGSRLAFASEIKALLALPEMPRALDPRALGELFTYWAPLPPHSVFAGIESLPPGHVMRVDARGIRLRRYWDWSFPIEPIAEPESADAAAEQLRALLTDAVRLQLRADVPVGAYLSGGLDSAIVAALIRHETTTPLSTFSLTFDDAEFDESAWQQQMVHHLGTEHTALPVREGDIAAAFPRAVLHAEAPLLRTAPAPMLLLAEAVRAAGYKVVLTGEGADEVFGGYDLYKEARVRRFMARQPQSRARAALLDRLYPWLKNSPAAGRAMTERFFREGEEQFGAACFGHLPRWRTTRKVASFLAEPWRTAATDWEPMEAIAPLLPAAITHWPPLAQDQYVEAMTLLSGYLLSSQGDRMSMAASVEGRVPFLDHRVIEFANALPPRYKLMGLTEKWLLKRSMAGRLPEALRQRTKQPYRAPDSASFFRRGEPVDFVADLLSPARIAQAGYFDPIAVTRLFDKARAGRVIGFGENMAFVAIVSTMLLHDQLIAPR